jgi:hypothetical protein
MNAEFILKVLNIKECNERKYLLSHEHQCHLVTHNSVSMFLLLPPRNAVLVFQYTHPALPTTEIHHNIPHNVSLLAVTTKLQH